MYYIKIPGAMEVYVRTKERIQSKKKKENL